MQLNWSHILMQMNILTLLQQASSQISSKRTKQVILIGDKIFGLSSSENRHAKKLWLDFISTIWPHFLQTRLKVILHKWHQLLRSRGVHVDGGRELSEAESLTIVLFRIENIHFIPPFHFQRLKSKRKPLRNKKPQVLNFSSCRIEESLHQRDHTANLQQKCRTDSPFECTISCKDHNCRYGKRCEK